MNHQTQRLTKYLIIGLLLVHLIPVWAFKFIPTQDGLNHVYNAYILKEYNNPNYTKFRQVYDLNIRPFPNWVSHAFFFAALHFVPPLIAEKIFVTLCVSLVPLSFFYFLHSVDKRLWFFGFLGFLYSYNVLLHLGFYNFAISVPVSFFTLGYWWKHRENLSYVNAIILNLLLFTAYFCHLFSFSLLIASIPVLALTSAVLPWDEPKPLKQRVWMLLRSAGCLMPACIVLLICLLLNPEEKTASYWNLKDLWKFFVSVKSLVYYNDRYEVISWFLLGFMGLCFLSTLWFKFRHSFHQRDGFLILFVVLTVLYFRLPWSYGPPAWINDRINLFLFPVLAAWFSFSYHKWIKTGMIAIMIILSLAHLVLTVRDYDLLNKDMEEFTSGAGLIAENSAVSILTNDYQFAENHGEIKYLSPFYHDTCYYCLGNGSHYVANYEPKYAYFPLQYKPGYWKFEYNGVIDYMLVWHMDENSPEVAQLKQNYRLIHQTRNLKLFQYRNR